MTRIEKSSQRKCKALKNLVEHGEYSASYALLLLEEFYDKGKIVESDYDTLSEYLEDLIDNPVEEEIVEEEIVEEPSEEPSEEGDI